MKVGDVMTREVFFVTPDTQVSRIAQLLGEKKVGAVPVVDDDKRVVGIISESDLFLKPKGIPFSIVKIPHIFNKWVEPSKLKSIYSEIETHYASDVMTTPVIIVSPEEEVGTAAALMYNNKVSRLPVVMNDELVGIIARSDIIRLMAQA